MVQVKSYLGSHDRTGKAQRPQWNRSLDFSRARSMTFWQKWDARILRVVFAWIDAPNQEKSGNPRKTNKSAILMRYEISIRILNM
jgi:hypothetical protein